MLQHPSREAGGGVGHGVADGLRSSAHLLEVSQAAVLDERSQALECGALLLREFRGRAAGEYRLYVGRDGRRKVAVDAQQSRRWLTAHRLDDAGAPISALGNVARIPQPLHEDVKSTADALQAPTR